MKPLFKITLLSRDPMDPESIVTAGIIEVASIGDIVINLTRDEMGVIKLESSEVGSQPGFIEQLKEAELTLKEAHEAFGAATLATQRAYVDMFAIHKWLTRD